MIFNFTLTNWTNLIIYKCGYSTLKMLFDKYIIYPLDDLYLEKTFIVMRDPIERFISLYKDLCLKENPYFHVDQYRKGIKHNMPIKEFIDVVFNVYDWHFVPLVMSHDFGNHKIDKIVLLRDLDRFIRFELKKPVIKHRNTTKDIVFDKTLIDPYIKMIKTFYRLDYKYLDDNKDLIYKDKL